ncbi:MAG: hypothetical protein ILO36_09245 [Abditibacteriota bacterium]|nr:hypothetical protein [Abditibacteriota bacterium]
MARDFCGAFADFGAAEEWLRRLAADTPPAAFEAGGLSVICGTASGRERCFGRRLCRIRRIVK